ncbi:MAG: DNA-binding protein [Oscillospiraceae bacterium]|nr:DNA-binding protein [Oscillospiraceae bacterium]
MKKNLGVNILLDVYGVLLTDRQRATLELYYGEDLSLGEISEETGITRQGVMNCIHKSEKKLFEFETRLGLIRKFRELSEDIDKLEGLIIQSEMTNKAILADIDDLIVEIKEKI